MALDIINAIEIDNYEIEDGTVLFINVEDNEENREKMRLLGYSDNQINTFKPYTDEPIIDICHFVWNHVNWFDDGEFSIVEQHPSQSLDEMVTISKDEYETLKYDSEFLSCLEACGVDNWEGYSEAIEMIGEEEEE